MTPRSLVGMSQRRRKEMFHVEFEAAREKDGTVSMFVADALLSKYRIGQRLRPCPGCHTCMPGVKGWHIDKVRGRFKMPTVAWSCDGSGVLPARAKKVRR